jgi:hypothetical protein
MPSANGRDKIAGEKEPPFCGNPGCVLYVRAGDPGVCGTGNWAQLGDGRIIGRVLCGGIYLCDACACEWLAVAVFESGDAPPAMAAN